MKRTVLIFILYSLFFILYSPPKAHALTMSNLLYILQMGNLNSFSGAKSNSQFKLNDTGGQLAPGLFSGSNYKIRSGFQYISSIIRFRFTISSIFIDFGIITPTNPVTRSNTLTISNGSAAGYSVVAFESHQLMSYPSGQLIPNTTCDGGTCTTSTGAAWTSSLAYGFGYRCDNVTGTDCASGFSTSTFYKQFADDSAGQTAVSVMSGANVGRNIKTQITYKVNISGSQAAGVYQNAITYIATPTF